MTHAFCKPLYSGIRGEFPQQTFTISEQNQFLSLNILERDPRELLPRFTSSFTPFINLPSALPPGLPPACHFQPQHPSTIILYCTRYCATVLPLDTSKPSQSDLSGFISKTSDMLCCSPSLSCPSWLLPETPSTVEPNYLKCFTFLLLNLHSSTRVPVIQVRLLQLSSIPLLPRASRLASLDVPSPMSHLQNTSL